MKLAALRCRQCGKERLVRQREKGATLACDVCGAVFEVPESLDFPEYRELYGDQLLAERMVLMSWCAFCFGCLPLAAGAWWIVAGEIARTRAEGRPVEPKLLRARNAAVAVTVVHSGVWLVGLGVWLL